MPESQHIEWKETWRDEFLKVICAFANAEGGVLHVGRNDVGVVVGVVDEAKLLEDIPNKVRDVLGILVEVNRQQEGEVAYLEILTEPYANPINYRGHYYVRRGSTVQELRGVELDRFLLRKQGRHWDSVAVPRLTAEALFSGAFERFVTAAGKSGRMHDQMIAGDHATLLDNLQLLDGDQLTRAAALLFAREPFRWVPGSTIKIGFFASDDDLRYQDEITGPLLEQVDLTLEVLRTKYLKAYISYEGVQRRENFPFPFDGLREAILNAVVHKDYASGIPIQLSVYDDRLVIWNPGQLPEAWTLDDLQQKHPSKPFNPLLAGAFFRSGYIESWGRGIEKINRACQQHDIPLAAFNFRLSGLMVTFTANPAHLASPDRDREGTPQATPQVTPHVAPQVNILNAKHLEDLASALRLSTPQVTPQVTTQVERLLRAAKTPQSREALQAAVGLADRKHFREVLLNPLLAAQWMESTIPEAPKSPLQKYFTTSKGAAWLASVPPDSGTP